MINEEGKSKVMTFTPRQNFLGECTLKEGEKHIVPVIPLDRVPGSHSFGVSVSFPFISTKEHLWRLKNKRL